MACYADYSFLLERRKEMFIALFLLWIIFNGNFTLEIAAFGIVISGAVYFFMCKFMDFNFKKDMLYVKRFILFARYVLVLIVEIIKANIVMASFILKKKEKDLHPVIFNYKTNLQTKMGRMLLANSITLTPGTITVSMIDNNLIINAIDESLSFSDDEFIGFEKLIRDMEEGHICR